MKKILVVLVLSVLLIACKNQTENKEMVKNPIIGTWELISSTTIENDNVGTLEMNQKRMIKVINKTHFAFFNHDVNKGQGSLASFISGGGKYTLNDSIYTEYLEFCNFREWEGNQFDFTIKIKGDTLIQSGSERIEELGVDRKIIETYILVER